MSKQIILDQKALFNLITKALLLGFEDVPGGRYKVAIEVNKNKLELILTEQPATISKRGKYE